MDRCAMTSAPAAGWSAAPVRGVAAPLLFAGGRADTEDNFLVFLMTGYYTLARLITGSYL